jgi:hypothetical protein
LEVIVKAASTSEGALVYGHSLLLEEPLPHQLVVSLPTKDTLTGRAKDLQDAQVIAEFVVLVEVAQRRFQLGNEL